MGTCILLERLWIDRNKHRLANKSEVCRGLWYPSLSYARRSIVLRLPVQENPVVRVTPTDSLWISAKPWNEQIKSSIFRQKNLQRLEVQDEITSANEYNASSLLEAKIKWSCSTGEKQAMTTCPACAQVDSCSKRQSRGWMAPITNGSVLIWIRYLPPLVVVHGSFLSVNVLSFDRIHSSIAIIALPIVALTHRVKLHTCPWMFRGTASVARVHDRSNWRWS